MELEDVKARLFFKASKDNSKKLIPEKDLIELKDKYFLARNDGIEQNNLRVYKNVGLLEYKLSVLKAAKKLYQDIPLNTELRGLIRESLGKIGYKLKIEKETSLKDIDNQFRSFIGSIKNSIEINKLNLVEQKKGDFDFASVIVAYEHILERSISEDISLAKFVAYEKQAEEIIKLNKKKNG